MYQDVIIEITVIDLGATFHPDNIRSLCCHQAIGYGGSVPHSFDLTSVLFPILGELKAEVLVL